MGYGSCLTSIKSFIGDFMMLRLAMLSAFCALSLLYALTPISEVEIPRTAYKSPYKFYLLEKTKKINTYEATYKCIGSDSLWFGKLEINCELRLVREVGESLASVKKITNNPSRAWYMPVITSFQADMMHFVCH